MEGLQYGIQQGYNPMTAATYASQPYGSQFGQQGQFGQQFGGANTPLGGLIGSGIAGLMSGQSSFLNSGRQPQVIDGFNGGMQPYNSIDPLTAAHIQQAQQTQLAQQAQLAQLIQQVQQLAQQLAQQQQFGRLPFGQQAQLTPWSGSNPLNRIDPITAAYIQQAQVAQLCQQLALQSQLGQQGQVPQFGHGQLGQNPLGFGQNLSGQQGQGQFGQQNWPGGGSNPWVNPQLATQFGRAPFQYGSAGGQLPVY